MAVYPTQTRRWTRAEYDRLIDLGFFQPGEHLELLAGQLVVGEPVGSLHCTAVGLVEETLRACFGPGWVVRGQMSIALDDESEPEPDVAVVPGTWHDYAAAHPARPVLVVEVAESSLRVDRGVKAGLYARGGINDYWIVNLVDRVLEVHRDPARTVDDPFGWRYGTVTTLEPGASIAPLARPQPPVDVGALFPRTGYRY
jgi:Uma2 family endonuclease